MLFLEAVEKVQLALFEGEGAGGGAGLAAAAGTCAEAVGNVFFGKDEMEGEVFFGVEG